MMFELTPETMLTASGQIMLCPCGHKHKKKHFLLGSVYFWKEVAQKMPPRNSHVVWTDTGFWLLWATNSLFFPYCAFFKMILPSFSLFEESFLLYNFHFFTIHYYLLLPKPQRRIKWRVKSEEVISKPQRSTPLGLWQRYKDSNLNKRSQSPVCYRYTIPLYAASSYYCPLT